MGGHGRELKEGAGEEEGVEGGETACHAGGSWSRKNSYRTTNLFSLLSSSFCFSRQRKSERIQGAVEGEGRESQREGGG